MNHFAPNPMFVHKVDRITDEQAKSNMLYQLQELEGIEERRQKLFSLNTALYINGFTSFNPLLYVNAF